MRPDTASDATRRLMTIAELKYNENTTCKHAIDDCIDHMLGAQGNVPKITCKPRYTNILVAALCYG